MSKLVEPVEGRKFSSDDFKRWLIALGIIFIGTVVSRLLELHGFAVHPWITTIAFMTGALTQKFAGGCDR